MSIGLHAHHGFAGQSALLALQEVVSATFTLTFGRWQRLSNWPLPLQRKPKGIAVGPLLVVGTVDCSLDPQKSHTFFAEGPTATKSQPNSQLAWRCRLFCSRRRLCFAQITHMHPHFWFGFRSLRTESVGLHINSYGAARLINIPGLKTTMNILFHRKYHIFGGFPNGRPMFIGPFDPLPHGARNLDPLRQGSCLRPAFKVYEYHQMRTGVNEG